MNSIAINQILILFLQCLIVATLLLSLFRLRTLFGLGLLFTALGVFQYLQVFLVSSIYIEIMPGIVISPAMVLFTGSIFAILLVYIREDALEARKIIYALVIANLALTLLHVVFGWAIEGEGIKNIYNLPKEFFTENAIILLLGTLILFIDAFAIIFIYEIISRYVSLLFLRILFSTVLIISFDSLFFSLFAFYGTENFSSVLVSGLTAKISAALFYSALFSFYLLYLDKDIRKSETITSSYKDIFNSLTFRQKYEQVYKEKETQKKELQKSEEYNRLLFNTSPVGLALCKMDGSLLDINPAYAKILGRTIEETLKLTYWDITPKKYAAQEVIQLNRLEEKGSYGPYEKEYIHKDGHLVQVVLNGLIIMQNGEKFIWSSIEDISSRKEAEAELIREKEFSEKIIETSSAIIVGLDKNHLIRLFNKGAENITGYSKAEVIGKDWFKIFFPDDVFNEMNKVWKEAWGRQTHSHINPIIIKSGEERIISFQNTGIYEGEDSSKHILISIGEDITEAKLAEAELRESEEKLRKLLEGMPFPLCYANKDGIITFRNDRFIQVFGYTENDVPSLNEWWIKAYPNVEYRKWVIQNWDAAVKNAIEKGTDIESEEYHVTSKDGSLHEIIISGITIGDDFLATFIDITDSKKADAKIKESAANIKSLIENRADSIWSVDKNLNYIIFNSFFADAYKITYDIELQKGMNVIEILSPEARNFWKPKYEAVLKGENIVFEFSEFIADKEHFFQVSLNPIIEEENITGVSALSIEITELKKANKELQKHQNQLEELVRERTQELEDKNSLLERTNKAFAGREVRMAELKKEIEELRREVK